MPQTIEHDYRTQYKTKERQKARQYDENNTYFYKDASILLNFKNEAWYATVINEGKEVASLFGETDTEAMIQAQNYIDAFSHYF